MYIMNIYVASTFGFEIGGTGTFCAEARMSQGKMPGEEGSTKAHEGHEGKLKIGQDDFCQDDEDKMVLFDRFGVVVLGRYSAAISMALRMGGGSPRGMRSMAMVAASPAATPLNSLTTGRLRPPASRTISNSPSAA